MRLKIKGKNTELEMGTENKKERKRKSVLYKFMEKAVEDLDNDTLDMLVEISIDEHILKMREWKKGCIFGMGMACTGVFIGSVIGSKLFDKKEV